MADQEAWENFAEAEIYSASFIPPSEQHAFNFDTPYTPGWVSELEQHPLYKKECSGRACSETLSISRSLLASYPKN